MSSSAFNVSPSRYLGRPLYVYNLEDPDCEKELLNYINAHYKDFTEGDIGSERRRDQTDNFAAYLGFSADIPKEVLLSESGPVYHRRTPFKKLRTHPIKYLTDELVARFVNNKPNYQIYTVNRNVLEEKEKTRTAMVVAKSIFSTSENNNKFKEFVRQAVIFAESYIEVFWNVDKGEAIGSEKIELINESGYPELDSEGNPIVIKRKISLGDYDLRLRDPRQTITQKADTFEESEWVILFSYEPVEKLRLAHSEKAKQIRSTPGLEDLDSSTMRYRDYGNHTILYKMYHRPTAEMPGGRLIEATPDVVLRNTVLPHKTLADKELFPVIQLRAVKAIGSERGIKSMVSQGKGLQLAKNNLLSMAIRNLVSFPPFRTWESGSMDPDKLRMSVPTDITYHRGGRPPEVSVSHVLSNEQLQLMNMIDQDLHKIFTVSPVSIGDTMPNMRSREMFDFVEEQESKQTFPIEDDIRSALIQIVQVVFAIVADEYLPSQKEKRQIRYFGARNKFMQEAFDTENLKEVFDIRIDTAGKLADTFQGKVQQLSSLMKILPPGTLSSNWIIDKFELGDVEEVLNVITGGADLARSHVARILNGKEAKSPQKWIDLVPYYEEFMKKLQSPEVLEILDESGYPAYFKKGMRNPEESLKGNDLIAFRLLDQINSVESMLLDAAQQQEAKGIVDPTTGISPLRGQLIAKFPAFPTVYEPDSRAPINPLEEPAVPDQPGESLVANPSTKMSAMDQTSVTPNLPLSQDLIKNPVIK